MPLILSIQWFFQLLIQQNIERSCDQLQASLSYKTWIIHSVRKEFQATYLAFVYAGKRRRFKMCLLQVCQCSSKQ